MKSKVTLGIFMIIFTGILNTAIAQDYPNRSITLMVPWPAGGVAPTTMQSLADIVQKMIGQPVVMVPKPGAGSQVGLTELSRQKPDGYYLCLASFPTLNTIILDPQRQAVFNIDSFRPIINHAIDPGTIWVKADSPYKTLKDLIEDAKKRPGKVGAGVTGILGDDHLSLLMLEKETGVKLRNVHFDGGAPMIAAVLGGHIDVGFENVGVVFHRIRAGQARGLAVANKERSVFLPDVPTTVELGYPNVISSVTRGILAPSGIPDRTAARVQEIFYNAMKDPEHIEQMKKLGVIVTVMVGEEYQKYLQNMHHQAKILVDLFMKSK